MYIGRRALLCAAGAGAAAVTAGLAGCGSLMRAAGMGADVAKMSGLAGSASDGAQDQLAAIKDKGEMAFGTEGTWAPWTYHDESDELTGFDIEVARAVAERLGVSATFAEGEWDGLFAGLDSGRYDCVANGVSVTEERADKYDFTDPYAYNRTVVIVREDDDSIASFEDLDGKVTANTISSSYTQLAESFGATVQGVDDLNQTIELLRSGRIDATLNDEVVFADYQREHPDSGLKVAAKSEDAVSVAFPLRAGEGSASLRKAMNAALADLRDDGTLAELSERFFSLDITRG